MYPFWRVPTRAPIKWADDMQHAFNKMHLLMAADALAAYPDHNKRFDVYTDASDFQLGACIIQEGRPIAYFLQKLTKSQQNYTTMEKERDVGSYTSPRVPSICPRSHGFFFARHVTFW
jgi:hypothetical protein